MNILSKSRLKFGLFPDIEVRGSQVIAIWLGYNFRGYFDELAIYNRDLNSEEIKFIFELDGGLNSIF